MYNTFILKEKQMAKTTTQSQNLSVRGLLFASAVIPLGVIAWLILWQYGFIASVIAWGIAFGAVWLYNFGSRAEVTRKAVPYVLAIIVLGVLAAFASGMIYDLWGFYKGDGGGQGFFSEEFLTGVWSNLTYWEFLSSYTVDFLISIAFAALGASGVVYGLFKQPAPKSTAKTSKKK